MIYISIILFIALIYSLVVLKMVCRRRFRCKEELDMVKRAYSELVAAWYEKCGGKWTCSQEDYRVTVAHCSLVGRDNEAR